MTAFSFESIGFVRSPFTEKKDAPRQSAASTTEGTIVLHGGRNLEDALQGIDAWSHLWVIYLFDRANGFRPKVQPPRATGKSKKGVLATRSPHRPNPLGMSAVRLLRVRGLEIDIAGIDMLDGTPVIDLKPYVSYTDVVRDASAGWLATDPLTPYAVAFTDEAQRALGLLLTHGISLEASIIQALAMGPEPHAYRRIRLHDDASVLAIKDWRVRFAVTGPRAISVLSVHSGFRPRDLLELGQSSGGACHRALGSLKNRRP